MLRGFNAVTVRGTAREAVQPAVAELEFAVLIGSGHIGMAGSDRDAEIQLRNIEQRRPHHLSSDFDLCGPISSQALGRHPPPDLVQQSLHEKLVAHRMFALLVPFFCEPAVGGELPMRHICVELLLLSAQNDPSHLRRFLTADGSSDGRALLSALISTVHMGDASGRVRDVSGNRRWEIQAEAGNNLAQLTTPECRTQAPR